MVDKVADPDNSPQMFMKWDKKVDQEAVAKVAKVVEKAMQDAEYKCQGLPFSLPNDKKLDGGEYNNSNFRAPDLF